jgi:hypothetical protein
MNALIKYHEKTEEKDQYITLDLSKHKQIEALNVKHANLKLYDGMLFYGKFCGYSRVDGYSYFELDTTQINRENKINQLLNESNH